MTGHDSAIVIDSYAWIEYLRGSKEGEQAQQYIDSQRQLYTPAIVLAELSDKHRRQGREKSWQQVRHFIQLRSDVLQLQPDQADEAGRLKQQLREEHSDAGLADAIILSHAIGNDAQIITGDRHMTHHDQVIDISV